MKNVFLPPKGTQLDQRDRTYTTFESVNIFSPSMRIYVKKEGRGRQGGERGEEAKKDQALLITQDKGT